MKSCRGTLVALGAIALCLLAELLVLRVGVDDLDEGYFAAQAYRVWHGQVPYGDFASLYTPGLAYLHAFLFTLTGGSSLLALRALSLVARAALALMLFVLARPLVRCPIWAAVPGVLLLVGLDDAPARWEPHPGWLSTLFAVVATWCLTRPPTRPGLAAAGAAAALSYVFKQNTGAFILAAIVIRPWLTPVCSGVPRPRQALWPVATFVGITLVWLVPLAAVVHGDLGKLAGFAGAVNQAGLFSLPEITLLIPLACFAGGLWAARTEPRLRWLLLAGTALFLTEYPRMDTLHLAWSAPILLVVGAVALDRQRRSIALIALFGATALSAPTIGGRFAYATLPLAPIGEVEAPRQTAVDVEGVVTDITRQTRPGEAIFVYPSSPLLYVLADRPDPTRYDHLNPGAASPSEIQQVIDDLQAAQPNVVIISDFWRQVWGAPGANAPLETWLDAHYRETTRHGAYRVLVARL